MKNVFNKLAHKIIYPTLFFRIYTLLLIIVMIFLVDFFVYYTGGTQYGFTHTMYIPIIIAGTIFGIKYGVMSALLAGILLGPLMPLNTVTNEPQLVVNWVFRLGLFTVIGCISGIAANIFKQNANKILKLHNFNQETGLPNINSMHSFVSNHKTTKQNTTKQYMTIFLNNCESILDLLGRDYYINLFNIIYNEIVSIMPENTSVFQSDKNKFWLYLEEEQDEESITKISNLLNQTFNINNIPLYVEFTIGVANKTGVSDYEHLKRSDTSAYYAQKLKIPFDINEPTTNYTNDNIELLGEFKVALETGRLELHYQPIIDLVSKDVLGLEALLRWQHPTRGNISPTMFIELVEGTQMINPLTEWVLNQSLMMLQHLHNQGIDTKISINLSAKNLQPKFLDKIGTILSGHPLSNNIEFEITESALMDDPDTCQSLLETMRIKGIQLSIDDFGTGYSSLTYLSRFPVQIVKIDQYFTTRMLEDMGIYHIVKSTIQLGHQLGMKVLAEGVEEEKIEQLLIDIKCDLVQGYYYAKPMNDKAIILWLKKYLEKKSN